MKGKRYTDEFKKEAVKQVSLTLRMRQVRRIEKPRSATSICATLRLQDGFTTFPQ